MAIRKAAIVAGCMMIAGSACAARPPLFQPQMPPDWSSQKQKQVDHALDVLFDVCPALVKWLPDMRKPMVTVDDMSKPWNKPEAEFFKPYGWSKILTVSVAINKPHGKAFADYTGSTFVFAQFYMGGGTKPGIFMENRFFPAVVCGAKHAIAIRTSRDGTDDKTIPADSFVPVPALHLIDKL